LQYVAKGVTRHFLLADDVAVSDTVTLAQRKEAVLETIIEAVESGLAGYAAGVQSHGSLEAPDPTSGGRYGVVIAGSAIFKGETLPPLSCVFVGTDDIGLPIDAGPSGAEVLVLQYPKDPEAAPRNRTT
jgi:hypothetical protein